ncbi:MAG: succinylglutamate desuccinylase [Phyllobacteriaceae bacterium]|nr:succinylglutamate desuccinylase [Phyllobacteriaceae bacterium]
MDLEKSARATVAIAFTVSGILTWGYVQMWRDDVIVPGPGVTAVKWLSDYHPDLKGTLGDTRVFVLEGKEPGGTFLVLGGTHCDETAGFAAALVLVEHATVQKGRVIVIPQMNNSGWTNNYPQEAHPQFITIPQKPDGKGRVFRFGSRTGNSGELWPDPEVFIQYPHKQKYSGEEIRNPNRAYPGRPDGTFEENVAYGIQMMHRKEHIDMQIDLHEGPPEYPFVNGVSSHKRAADIGSAAVLEMQMADLNIGMETSPDSFRGLSNLELGDMFPHLYAFTSETVNPIQGKIRGITDEYLTVDGVDAFYDEAAKIGFLFTPWPNIGSPLKLRVGRNLQLMRSLTTALADAKGIDIVWGEMPTYKDLMANGVGHYLNEVPAGTERPGIRALPGFWRYLSKAWSS